MIISINAHPEIRELFKDLPVVEVDYQYTGGGAERRSDCTELVCVANKVCGFRMIRRG